MGLTYADFKNRVASKKTAVAQVDIPALGGAVHICKMSAADRDRLQATLLDLGKDKDKSERHLYRARVVVAVVVDDQGNKIFTAADEAWLAGLDSDILEPIVQASDEINSARPAKELEKNSVTTQPAVSVTA